MPSGSRSSFRDRCFSFEPTELAAGDDSSAKFRHQSDASAYGSWGLQLILAKTPVRQRCALGASTPACDSLRHLLCGPQRTLRSKLTPAGGQKRSSPRPSTTAIITLALICEALWQFGSIATSAPPAVLSRTRRAQKPKVENLAGETKPKPKGMNRKRKGESRKRKDGAGRGLLRGNVLPPYHVSSWASRFVVFVSTPVMSPPER